MERENARVLGSTQLNCSFQPPGYADANLLSCGIEASPPYWHPISEGKGVVYGKLEVLLCFVKAHRPGEYQLVTLVRNYAVEVEVSGLPGDQGTDRDTVWAEFQGDLEYEVHEVPRPLTGSKRLEVKVSGVIAVLTKERPEAAAKYQAPLAPEIGVADKDRNAVLPEPGSSPVQYGPFPHLLRRAASAAEPLPPEIPDGGQAGETPGSEAAVSQVPGDPRPWSTVFRGAETIPPMIWRMPGRG